MRTVKALGTTYIATTSAPEKFVQKDPPAKLVKLIKEKSDGGKGEYEKYIPPALKKLIKNSDATYLPSMDGNNVIWEKLL